MIRTIPFTSHMTGFMGTAPYFAMPSPQAPSIRSDALIGGNGSAMSGPPGGIASPAPGWWTRFKSGNPPALTSYQSTALTPQGPVTYSSAGTGYIRS